MSLTGRVPLVALAGALVALLSPAPGATAWAVVALLALGVVADLALAGPVRPLRFTRDGDAGVRLGEEATVRLTVANPSRRTVRGVLRDAWPPSAGASPWALPLRVPSGEQRLLTTTLRPTRRGERRAATVTVRSVGPLGLAARQGRHDVPWAVRVLPPFTSRRHLPEKLARLRRLDGQVAARVRGPGTEFDSLRDYVPGDDVRAIDWRATARREGVVVRTWRPERDRRLVLVLDTGRTSAGRVGEGPRLDSALDAALLLAALASRAGDRVDLIAGDRVVRADVEGSSRVDVLPRLVAAMATLESELVEADTGMLVAQVLRRARQRCLVVLFTGLEATAVEEGLLPALPALTRRHVVLVAAVADPRVEEMASARGDAEAVYGAAAAEQARAERRRVSALLRRRGVEVVDAPPDELAPALADAYLDLKAAGRL